MERGVRDWMQGRLPLIDQELDMLQRQQEARQHIYHEDDDEPLANVLARRTGRANPAYSTVLSTSASLSQRFTPRVRRGSEGYEVNPPAWHLLNAQSFEDPHADVEGMYEEGSEGSD